MHQNRSTINAVQTFPGVAYGWKQRSYDFIKAFGPLKISGYTLAPSGSSTGSLVVAGGVAWVDGRNYTIDPNEPSYIQEAVGIATSKIYRYRQSGSNWVYDTNGGLGYATIDPTQYSNNGVLTPVSSNQFSIQRVFYFPNSGTKALYIYYGNAQYSNETEALAAVGTETFTEAPNTAANAIYLGYMLLRNDANFTIPASYTIYQAGLFRGGGSGGAGGGGGATTLASLSDVSLSSPTDGQALVYNHITAKWENKSFISASISGNAATATTSSFAVTASYALNGGVTQIVAGTNITLSPTNGLGAVTINSSGGTLGFNTTQSFTNSSTWTFNHNLDRQYVVIQTVDSNGNQIIPENIALTSANTATITFPTPESGIAIASIGGIGTTAVTASYVLQAVSASSSITSSYVTPYETAWTSYTPVWTAASVNPVIGNGSLQGWYKVIGKTCFVRGNIVMGTTTTFGSGEWYVSMPVTASHADAILMAVTLLDNGTAWYNATMAGARAGFNYKAPIQYQSAGLTANDVNATQPFTWASTDRFIWNGSYEIL